MRLRLPLLPAALALTLAATAWVAATDQGDDEAPVQPRAAARGDGTARAHHDGSGEVDAAATGPAVAAATPAAPTGTDAAAALPAMRGTWAPAPSRALAAWGAAASASGAAVSAKAAASAAAAAASQTAPPPRFPYTWIGRIDTGGDVQALLNGPQRSFGARAGEVLDGRWRIEQVAATRLQLTWLPTGETVMLDAR